jgi:hydroxyquinol 1,2-dioxygenase
MDGPVRDLVSRTEISDYRPAHVHFFVKATGFVPLITHLFEQGTPYLDTDHLFGTKKELVVPFSRHDGGTTPAGGVLDRPWIEARYDVVLHPDDCHRDACMRSARR